MFHLEHAVDLACGLRRGRNESSERTWQNVSDMAMIWELYGNAECYSWCSWCGRMHCVQAMGGCESCASGRRKEVSRRFHWSRVGTFSVSWRLNAWLMMPSCALSFELCRIRDQLVAVSVVAIFFALFPDVFCPHIWHRWKSFFLECPYCPYLIAWLALLSSSFSSMLNPDSRSSWELCISALSSKKHWQAAWRLSKPPRCHPKSISASGSFFLSMFFSVVLIFFLFLVCRFSNPFAMPGRVWRHGCACCKAWRRHDFETDSTNYEIPRFEFRFGALWGSSMLRWPSKSASRRSVLRRVTISRSQGVNINEYPKYPKSLWDFFIWSHKKSEVIWSLEDVRGYSCLQSLHIYLPSKKPAGDASLGCLHTRWRWEPQRRFWPREPWVSEDFFSGDPSSGHRGGLSFWDFRSFVSRLWDAGRDIVSRFLVLGSSKEALAGVSGGSWVECRMLPNCWPTNWIQEEIKRRISRTQAWTTRLWLGSW